MRRRQFIAGLSSAAAWPLGARAQQRAVPVIACLFETTESGATRFRAAAFRQGIGELGYVEGGNVEILYSYAEGQNDRLTALAADLVRRRVSVIAALSTPAALAVKAATATIPIVFVMGTDPVALGLVASLNRPGGNVTGVSLLATTLTAKRLELLHEIVPGATSIGFLVSPTNPGGKAQINEAQSAARALGLRLVIANASTSDDIETAVAALGEQRVGALLVGYFPIQPDQLIALITRLAVPAIYISRDYVDAGGLMSYGANLSDGDHLAGTYTGRILRGEKPADLPVQQATKIELAINMKTAKALGLTFPLSILGRADAVIE